MKKRSTRTVSQEYDEKEHEDKEIKFEIQSDGESG